MPINTEFTVDKTKTVIEALPANQCTIPTKKDL